VLMFFVCVVIALLVAMGAASLYVLKLLDHSFYGDPVLISLAFVAFASCVIVSSAVFWYSKWFQTKLISTGIVAREECISFPLTRQLALSSADVCCICLGVKAAMCLLGSALAEATDRG
jgi:hypothetical protein